MPRMPSASSLPRPLTGALESVTETVVVRGRRPLPKRAWAAFTAGFVGFAVPVVGFVDLAHRVRLEERIAFDRPVSMWIHRWQTPATTRAVRAVTETGGVVAVPTFALALAAYFGFVKKQRRPATLLTASLVGSTTINSILKALYKRPRPTFFEHIVTERSHSFPSGHAMASMSLALCVCVLTWRSRWRPAALAGSAAYVPTVGATRIYLGVHFPSDVLAGWLVATTWVGEVVTLMWLLERLETRRGG